MVRFSLEATRPSAAEIAQIAAIVGPGCPIYLSAVPSQSFAEQAASAALVRRAGLEPVPHLAARRIETERTLGDILLQLRGEADVRRVLVIAGDVDTAGMFPDALAVIRSGALQHAGIEEAGIAGYPESHPRISAVQIETALRDKIAAAAGLRLHIVSQFSFDPDAVVGWLRRLRAQGIVIPVSVGMAGPASLQALLRYAKRCGVAASLRGLMSGAAANLAGNAGPGQIVDALAHADGLGDVTPHYFSFGGIVETARFAHDTAAHSSDTSRAMSAAN